MPLRDPVFNPPFNIVRASHVELGVADVARSRAFYVDCLGYIVSDEDGDALYLRAVEERNHHSVVLRKSREIVCTGIRFSVGLQFNRNGDLFCTDQEGATWCPGGNPVDEFLHIIPGRNYGFPPRHLHQLPDVVVSEGA